MSQTLPDYKYVVELVGGGVMTVLAFFGKITLSDYDKRIESVETEAEKKDDRVMEKLNAINIKLERLTTVIEERTKPHSS